MRGMTSVQKEHRRSEPRAASSDTLWAPGPLWLSKPVTGCGTPREEEVTLTEVLLARAMPGKGWELRLFAPPAQVALGESRSLHSSGRRTGPGNQLQR